MVIKIGEILLKRGMITLDALNRALTMHRRSGARLGVCLVRMGYVDEEALASALGEQLGVPVAPSSALDDVPPSVIERVPRQVAEAHSIVPIRVDGREVHVCLADPQNLSRLDEIAFTLGCRIRPFLATEMAIDRALKRYYTKGTDVWDEALSQTGEWRVEQTGSWRIAIEQNPPPLPVVEAEVALVVEAEVEALPDADDPYERLAAVQTRADMVAAMSAYFGRLFANLCLLEVVPGGTRCVGLRRADQEYTPSDATTSVEGAGWLKELLARPQVVLRQKVSDPHLHLLLEGLGLSPTLVAVVPVFDYGRLEFVLLGQGLGADELKGIFGELKPYLASVSETMRMLALRDLIRKRARRSAAAAA
jgi:hypothetical protein